MHLVNMMTLKLMRKMTLHGLAAFERPLTQWAIEELLLHGGVLLPVSSIVYCLTKMVSSGRAIVLVGPESESLQVSPTILHIPLPDLPSADILSHFSTMHHFIDTALHNPTSHILVHPFHTPCMTPFHPIQVHCFKGMSRSPTIIAAYLIATLKLSTDNALSHIKSTR